MEDKRKLEIIKMIMDSSKTLSEHDKVSLIQSFLLGWITEEDLQWLKENQ